MGGYDSRQDYTLRSVEVAAVDPVKSTGHNRAQGEAGIKVSDSHTRPETVRCSRPKSLNQEPVLPYSNSLSNLD